MGENFPEGTSASDPSAVPRIDRDELGDESPRQRDEEQALGDVGRDDPADRRRPRKAPKASRPAEPR